MRILRSILPVLALAFVSTRVAFAACAPISMAPGDVSAGTVQTPYNLTFTASGSAATPFAYEVTSGVLPGGLTLNSVTGTLTGSPTTAGNFPITVTATDTAGCSGGRAYALNVAQGNQTISFTSTAPAAATVGGPTYAVTATATSGLPVAFTIDATATSVCSIAGSTVSFIGIGTCVIDANQAGNANYTAAPQVQQSFAVGQGTQTITFTSTAPAAASVGGPTYNVTATATSGLPVTFAIDATATGVCSIAGSTVSFLASGTCVIDANQAGNANYAAAPQVQQSFGVGKSAQTITFTSTAPAAAVVAGATYTVTATASSGLTVAFTIDATASTVCSIAGSTVSFIGAGTCVIDANQAGDVNYNPAPQVQQSFAVGKGNQTITYTSTAPVGATVGGATYTVTATATSGLAVAFTIDASATTVCSIAGSTVSFIGVGNCVIDANQAGNANYNAAPQVQQSFAVAKGNQTINFTSTAPVGATVGGPTYTVTATATSGLVVALTIDASASTVCSIAGSTVSFIGVGTCVIDANQAGNANYNAAPQVQQSFAVAQGTQTITFTSTAPAAATVGGPTYNVTATATSGLAVTFTIDATAASVCSIAGSTVSFIGAGTCVIDANQAGNANYAAAPQAQQSFGVAKNNQTISFTSTAPAGAAVAGPTYTVAATATSGLAVTFTIDATAASVCSIAGSTVSFIGVGTCVIDANQAGNGSYNAAPQVQQSFAVAKGNQTISYTSSAPAGASVGGATYTVSATATSGLAVTFTIDATAASVCSIAGSTVSFIGAGTCVIDANQPGNANYNAAPQVQQSFAVAKGNQTISFTSTAPVGAQFNGPTYTVTATATSGLAVTFTIDATASSVCSIAGSTVSFIGVGTCVIDANQAGDANYNAAPQVQQSFAVGKADQTISFTSTPPSPAFVNGTYNVTATATSGLAVTFSAGAPAVCTVAGSTVTFVAAGSCIVNANQAGNGNYNAAPQVQQTFTVVKNDQTITFTSTAPAGAKVGGPTYTVSATATSGLAVTFTIDAASAGACTIAGAVVSFVHATTCIIDANQAGNGAYNAALQVQQTFAIAKGDQTINVTSTAPTFGSATAAAAPHTYTVTATTTSGLAIVVSIDGTSTAGSCSVASPTVTFGANVGTCVMDVNQPGNADWNAAPQVQQSTTVEIPVTAGPDSHTVTGNVVIAPAAANGVLVNDTGNPLAITTYGVNGTEVAAGATPTSQGGSITLNADGSYTFTPKANFNGTDTFKYTIANHVSSAVGTVSLVVADRIMVVTVAGGGSCFPASPCTLANADAAAAIVAKDLVFVESGAYTSPNATITLNSGQNIVGNFVSLSQAITDAGITLAPDSVALPTINASTTPTLTNAGNVITLGGGNLVEYFSITNSAGSAILGNVAGSGTSNIHDITVTDAANAGTGVTISANVGTLNFSNLIVTTSSGGAFAATGGGSTINVTTGSNFNSLTSTTGMALNVTNTTIGASGMTFRSISSNGAANGINLNNTGAGSFTVTGNGSTCTLVTPTCDGGSIQSSTGQGILFNKVGSVSLTRMKIQNSGTSGVGTPAAPAFPTSPDVCVGACINGFTLDNSIVTDSAGGAVDDGLVLTNVTGTVSITNSAISNAPHNGIKVDNFNYNMTSFTMNNVTISCAAGQPCQPSGSIGNDGLLFTMRGTAVLSSGLITGSTFSGLRATGAQITAGDTGKLGTGTAATLAAGNSFTVQNSTFTGNNAGVDIDESQLSNVSFRILSNTLTNQHSQAINAFTTAAADTGPTSHIFVGLIDNNSVGVQGTKDSGSAIGSGVRVIIQGDATQGVVTVSNNTLREIPNADTITLFGQNGRAVANTTTAHFKVVNNILPQPTGTNQSIGCGAGVPCMAEGPVFVQADEAVQICEIMTGNNIYNGQTMNAAADVYLAERVGPPTGSNIMIEGSGTVTSYLTANNTLAAPQPVFDESGGVTTVAAGTCGTFP